MQRYWFVWLALFIFFLFPARPRTYRFLAILNPESLSDEESVQCIQRKIDGGTARLEGGTQSVNKNIINRQYVIVTFLCSG
jgi:cell division protein FtsW (lipid II flippase)